jgi:hypothetical protein
MCIVYRAVPPGVKSRAAASGDFPEQAFGRRVPVALALLYAGAGEREAFRRAAEDLDWAAFQPLRQVRAPAPSAARAGGSIFGVPRIGRLPLGALFGGPPAEIDADGLSRLHGAVVEDVAAALQGFAEDWIRAEHGREREHVDSVLDEASAVRCHALLRDFFVSAAASGSDVVVEWEYR